MQNFTDFRKTRNHSLSQVESKQSFSVRPPQLRTDIRGAFKRRSPPNFETHQINSVIPNIDQLERDA